MRNLYLSIFLLLPLFADAQYAKYELVEWFTNTWCPICSSRNPALRATYNQSTGQLHRITIHPSVPYMQCPLYNFNKEDNGARQSFYGISGTPTLYINGIRSSSSASVFENDLKNQENQFSPLAVEVVDHNSIDRNAQVTIRVAGAVPEGNYKLFVALLEKSVNLQAQNGETDHLDVLRAFISSNEGDDFDMPAAGASTTLSYDYTIPNGVVSSEAYVIAYVQDITSKLILNSGTPFDETITSLNDVAIEAEVKTFPNPTSDLINISVGRGFQIHKVDVFNQVGQQMRSVSLTSPEAVTSISVADLPSGNYLLHLDLGNKKGIVRFIKD